MKKLLVRLLGGDKIAAIIAIVVKITRPAEAVLDHVIVSLQQSEENEALIAYIQEVKKSVLEISYLIRKIENLFGIESVRERGPITPDAALKELQIYNEACENSRFE